MLHAMVESFYELESIVIIPLLVKFRFLEKKKRFFKIRFSFLGLTDTRYNITGIQFSSGFC